MKIKYLFGLGALLICAQIKPVSAQSNALHFDGIDDHVLTTFQGPTGNQARTVEAWIRTSANADPNNGGTQKVILDWGNMATGSRFTFNLLFFNGLRIEVQGSGLNSTRALNDGLWHHVAAVYDPTLSTQKFKLYVDGLLDTAGNLPTTVNTSSINALRLGRRLDGIHHFEGEMDEVRCWNVALSAADILNAYNREFCGLPSGLAAYYTLNSGIAGGTNTFEQTAFDRVANNHGTLQNFALTGNTSNWVAGAINSPISIDTLQINSCGDYLSLGGTVLTSSGIVYDTLISSLGCDSIIRQEVSINRVNTTISLSQQTLSALSPAASGFQWLDCDNNFSPIPGETQSVYQPNANGNYAVEITEGNCIDTSSCLTVMGVFLKPIAALHQMKLYPNPNSGSFEIKLAQEISQAEWYITDMLGKRIVGNEWIAGDRMRIDLHEIPKGQYIFILRRVAMPPSLAYFIKE
jgi:hypothetical protein